MFDIILNCGKQMSDVIGEISDSVGEVEIKEILARYSTDVIGCCAFGLDCNTMRNPEAEFRRMGRRAFTQTVSDVVKMVSKITLDQNTLYEIYKVSSFFIR